jgi:hypothetical protein
VRCCHTCLSTHAILSLLFTSICAPLSTRPTITSKHWQRSLCMHHCFFEGYGGGAPPPAGLTQLSRAEPDCWGHHWQGLCVPVTVAGCSAHMACI